MVKMIALYQRPEDIQGFLDHYENVHMPIVRQLPGLRKVELNKFFDLRGGEANPFLLAEMYFESRDALLAALKSPAGKESGKDAQAFFGKYVQVMFADVEVEEF
jgi:uncharacterized protein (TIGR02118 family)